MRVRSWLASLPAWWAVLLGAASAVLGVVLVVRPFASVEVSVLFSGIAAVVAGLAELTELAIPSLTRWRRCSGAAGWLILGLLLLMWPTLPVAGLAVLIGIGLIVSGLRSLLDVRAEPRFAAKIIAALTGSTSFVFGVLALSWPDITVFVVGVLFGSRMVWFGLTSVIDVISKKQHPNAMPPRPRRGFWVATLRSAGFAVALLLLGLTVSLHKQVRTVTPFYDWAAAVPSTPG